MVEWCISFCVNLTLTLTSSLISRFSCLEHIFSYLTANFPQMCLMLDQFLWGHSSRVCDISCFQKDSFTNTIRVSNRLDLGQDRHSDLGTNYFHGSYKNLF